MPWTTSKQHTVAHVLIKAWHSRSTERLLFQVQLNPVIFYTPHLGFSLIYTWKQIYTGNIFSFNELISSLISFIGKLLVKLRVRLLYVKGMYWKEMSGLKLKVKVNLLSELQLRRVFCRHQWPYLLKQNALERERPESYW